MSKITYSPTKTGLSVKLDGQVVGRIVSNAPLRPGDPEFSHTKMRYRYVPKGAYLSAGGEDFIALAQCKASLKGWL